MVILNMEDAFGQGSDTERNGTTLNTELYTQQFN